MLMIILLLGALSFIRNRETKVHFMFIRLNKIILRVLRSLIFLLFWIGARPVVYPYDSLGKLLVLSYFFIFVARFFKFGRYFKK